MDMKEKCEEDDRAGKIRRMTRGSNDERNRCKMMKRCLMHNRHYDRGRMYPSRAYVVFLIVLARFHQSMASFCPTVSAGGNAIVPRPFPSSSSPSSREIRAGYACHYHAGRGATDILPGLRRIRVGPNGAVFDPIQRGYVTRAYLAKKFSWGNPFSSKDVDDDNDNDEKENGKGKGKEKEKKKFTNPFKGKEMKDDSSKKDSSSANDSSTPNKKGKFTRFVNAMLPSKEPPPPPPTTIENAIGTIEAKLTTVRLELNSLRLGSKTNEPNKRETENRLEQILATLEDRRQELLEEQRKKRAVREVEKEERRRAQEAERERKAAERERKAAERKLKSDSAGNATNATNPVLEYIGGAQSYVASAWESTMAKRAQWITVCPKTQIAPGQVLPVQAGGLDLLIVASTDGLKLHCITNSCPHLGTPLETGPLERRKVENKTIGPKQKPMGGLPTTSLKRIPPDKDGCEECIVCPLHKTAFALESGEVRGEWCPYPPILGKLVGTNKAPETTTLTTFELRTRGKNVEVRINSRING